MLIGVLIVVPNGTSALSPGWITTKVYDYPFSSYGANENAIALDSHGHVHIAFVNNSESNDGETLMYATNASGSWVWRLIDSTHRSGFYASIAVDSNDRAHIAYFSANEHSVKYATNASGDWVVGTVIARYDPDPYSSVFMEDGADGVSLALNSTGIPHIFFTSYTNSAGTFEGRHLDAMMAVKNGSAWDFETIDGATGQSLYIRKSLAIDSSDHCHIVYSLGGNLIYANNTAGPWAKTLVDTDNGYGGRDCMTLDPSGHVGISYFSGSSPTYLKFANNAGGSWVNESVVEGMYRMSSLAYDAAGNPRIMTFESGSSTVRLYAKTGGSWAYTNPLGMSWVITSVSMVFDGNSKAHVGYTEYGDLNYATNNTIIDLYDPSITITLPSASGSYSTSSSPISVSGTASDDIGVTTVTWTNDRGGSGTAYGTADWSINSIALLSGENVITVTAHDAAGKSTDASITVTYTPDTTNPTVTITSPASSATLTTYVDNIAAGDLAGTASDNIGVTSVTCHNNANGMDVGISGTTSWETTGIMPLVTGSNEIVITAFDAAGNSGTDTITVTYALDTSNPVVSISSPSDGSATNSTTVSVHWTGSDNVGIVGFQYRLDSGGWSTLGSDHSHVFSGLSQGEHSVEVRAVDSSDNVGAAVVYFTVDLVSPTLSIGSPVEGSLVNTSAVSWSGDDTLSGIDHYLVRVDNGLWSDPLHVVSTEFPSLADGPHQVLIRAYDRAGNFADRLINFTLDATPPVLNIAEPSSGAATNETAVTVEWGATDPIAGIASYQFRIDGGAWSSPSMAVSHSFGGLNNGLHNVTIRATDLVGNAVDRYVVFMVDTLAPTLTIEAPMNNTHFNTTSVNISWSSSDQYSGLHGYQYRLDGGIWSSIASNKSHIFNQLADGAHTLEVRAFDNASNSISATVTFVVDTTAPTLSITSPSGTTYATNVSSMSMSGASSDNNELVEVTWSNSRGGSGTAVISGGNWSIASIALQSGNNVITVTARDASNNTATRTITVAYAADSTEKNSGLDASTLAILLVVVIVVIVAVVFMFRRGKK
jgi:hypothetical protein